MGGFTRSWSSDDDSTDEDIVKKLREKKRKYKASSSDTDEEEEIIKLPRERKRKHSSYSNTDIDEESNSNQLHKKVEIPAMTEEEILRRDLKKLY